MSSLSERLSRGAVSPTQVDHARRLVADWQLLADLAFADLTLWVPLPTGAWWCVAQVRPLTAPTSRPEDLVGAEVDGVVAEPFGVAHREGRPVTEGEPDWSGAAPRRREVIPVRHDGVVVAVLAKDTNLAVTRSPSTLELTYLDIAADLCLMVSAGTFPPQKLQDAEMSPRVGDGLVRLDGRGRVRTPARTRCRPTGGSAWPATWPAPTSPSSPAARRPTGWRARRPRPGSRPRWSGRFPDPMDVEGVSATMFVRALPLRPPGGEAGALVLVRDVTDVRRRDRALLTKDATIREIHHRVKNNLQTVAALLRLQARRMTEPAARAALEESVRRVASIAVVHDTLAGSREDVVAVDDVLDQVLPMLGDLASIGQAARTRRTGSFGELPAAAATPLVLAVTELLHNAAEHAFPDGEPGIIELVAERDGDDLVVRVRDDGKGLPDGFDPAESDGLGLQIVRTLVASELGGSLTMTSPPPGRRGRDRGAADHPRRRPAPPLTRPRPAREVPDRPRGGTSVLVVLWLRSGGASGGAHPGTSLAPLQRAPLVLGKSTPDTGVLARAQRPVQARLDRRAAAAHGLRLLDLDKSRAGRPDGEEQLGVLVPAERAVAPVHGFVLLGVVLRSVRASPASDRGSGPTPVAQRLWLSDFVRLSPRQSFVTGKLRSSAMFSREERLSSRSGTSLDPS